MWLILRTLRSGAHRAQTEIAASIGIQGPTLTRHLDNLDRDGLIKRVRDERDRRNVQIELTKAGEAKFDELLRAATTFDRRLRAGFTEEELDELGLQLQRLQANVRSR